MEIARNYEVPQVHNLNPGEYTTIVDAIFGVGLARPVEGIYAQILRELNQASAFKVAVDLPSGIDADNGQELGTAFCFQKTWAVFLSGTDVCRGGCCRRYRNL